MGNSSSKKVVHYYIFSKQWYIPIYFTKMCYSAILAITTVYLNRLDDQLMQHMQEGSIVYFICIFKITEFFKCSISLILIKIKGFK